MRKVPATVTAVALLGSAIVGAGTLTTSALANTACVTKSEFSRIMHGMTEERVAEIFGTHGTLVLRTVAGGHVYTKRQYPPCPKQSYVSVSYRDGLETSKSATWGSFGLRDDRQLGLVVHVPRSTR